MNTFIKSLLAGILIGIGVIINTVSSIPELGAFLFSFGLLSIIYMQLPLYTGKIGFLAKGLPQMLFGNLMGSAFVVGIYGAVNSAFLMAFYEKAAMKFTKGYDAMFIYAFFCGILIHFAVKQKQVITTIMAIMIFILIGAEHCVADFPYYLLSAHSFSFENTIKFILVIIGNSMGAIFIEGMYQMAEPLDKNKKL